MKNVHKTDNLSDVQLAGELAELRKGIGLTPTKLHNKQTIRGLISRLTDLSAASLTDSQVHAFLIAELAKIKTSRNGLALYNALGLGEGAQSTLSARRAELAAQLRRHPDTIERYENQGLVDFAACLINQQSAQAQSIVSSAPAYLQHLEEQAAKSKTATTLGLSGLLSLERRAEELVSFLESSPRPYLDTNIDILFHPSKRGDNWYRMIVTYSFQGKRETFRTAAVTTNEDGERLMKLGLVDEFHKLNDTIEPTREIRALMNGSRFTLRSSTTGHQKLLRLQLLDDGSTKQLLQSLDEPLLGPCRILEVTIPSEWQTNNTIYEYYNAINLRDDIHYAYWYAPSLMFVKKLTFDYSKFPGKEKWQFMALPFLGHIAGDVLDRHKYSFILHPNSWIMPGHGIGLTWE